MATMFANALAYEQLMGRWSTRLAPLFLAFAGVTDDGRILDVGCGTGSLVMALAAATRRSEIVGIDPAEPFIDYARTRIADPRVRMERGDAMALSFPDASFAHALSLLVLHFVPRPEEAAREMRRVTAPGGIVAACTWERERLEMTGGFWDEAIALDPGAVAARDRQRHLSRAGELTALWRDAGLADVQETGLEIEMDYASFDDYWRPIHAGTGPLGAYLLGLPPARQDALREAVRSHFQPDGRDGAFTLRATALAVRGVVPTP